jgi:predicted nucleotidyltransferase
MDTIPEQIADRVKAFVDSMRRLFPVREAYLFGSWAEGRQRQTSDIDIGIVLAGRPDAESRFRLFSLGKDFDVDFDVLALSEDDFESEDPVVVHQIKTKGKRIA